MVSSGAMPTSAQRGYIHVHPMSGTSGCRHKCMVSSEMSQIFHLWGQPRATEIGCMFRKSLEQPGQTTQKRDSDV